MTSENLNRRSVIVATIAAGLLVLALGLTHRILAARLLTPLSNIPINPAALDDFPLQIDDWMGDDVPIDEAEVVLNQINADACVNRRYLRNNGTESILLFIAASGVTAGTIGHPPEVCNVVNGYTLTGQRSMELPLRNGTKLPCRILQFHGGLLDEEKKTVLYYYMADEQFCGDRSQLRLRVRRGRRMVHCIAQVQIVASSTAGQPADSATRLVSDFAVDSAPAIARLFKNLEKELSSGNSGTACEER